MAPKYTIVWPVKVRTLLFATLILLALGPIAFAQPSPNVGLPLYVASATYTHPGCDGTISGGTCSGTSNNCKNDTTPCLTISHAVGIWASMSWDSGFIQINLLDAGPFSGLYLTNTFTGNAGYNIPGTSPGPANDTNSLVIVGNSATAPAVITAIQGTSTLDADIICASGAQLRLANVEIQIASNNYGIEPFSGCQVTLGETVVFEGPTFAGTPAPDPAPAYAALFEQYGGIIRVDGNAAVTFTGAYDTILNTDGGGEIEFSGNYSGTPNSVACTYTVTAVVDGTPTSVPQGVILVSAFIDAELGSVVNFDSGWNWDATPSGCGYTAGNVSGASYPEQYYPVQVAVTTGSTVSNGTAAPTTSSSTSVAGNLPGPCAPSASPSTSCVKIQTGAVLAPIGTLTNKFNLGGCLDGEIIPETTATNYAGGIQFTKTTSTVCTITFASAGGTGQPLAAPMGDPPNTPLSSPPATPAFTYTPTCTASVGVSSPAKYVTVIPVYTISGGFATVQIELTSSTGTWSANDTVYYVCSAPPNG